MFRKSGGSIDPLGNPSDFPMDKTWMMGYAENMKSPRMMKSHLHFEFLPKQIQSVKPKIIYVAQNVKDVVVSFLHHHCLLRGYTGTLDEFVDAFITDNG